MLMLKGHFDGRNIVLDEAASLEVGQSVRVVVDYAHDLKSKNDKAKIEVVFTPHFDPTAELMGMAINEQDIVRVDALEAMPSDFVRKAGSGAGTIKIAEDFDETPSEFKDYT